MKEVMKMLRDIRCSKGLTIDEVHNFLLKNGIQVSKKTVYGWDRSTTTPNIKTFVKLCKFYGIKDVYSLFDEEAAPVVPAANVLPITSKEERIIVQFRRKKEFQEPILKLLDLDKC